MADGGGTLLLMLMPRGLYQVLLLSQRMGRDPISSLSLSLASPSAPYAINVEDNNSNSGAGSRCDGKKTDALASNPSRPKMYQVLDKVRTIYTALLEVAPKMGCRCMPVECALYLHTKPVLGKN